jgi:hypothetical protein
MSYSIPSCVWRLVLLNSDVANLWVVLRLLNFWHPCVYYLTLKWRLSPSLVDKEFEDTKRVIRIHKDRQHNGHKKKDKRTNNDLQNITHKTEVLVTRTPLRSGTELLCSGRVCSSCSTSDSRRTSTMHMTPFVSRKIIIWCIKFKIESAFFITLLLTPL